MNSTQIFAHRGASKLAPENTMPAFLLALSAHADGIETDVQLTRDHVPVLIHDEELKRTTNGTGMVQDFTYEELMSLDAGSWFSSKYSDATIVTLDEFLRWLSTTTMQVNVELKTNVIEYTGIESIVYESLKRFGVVDRTIISSFNSESIRRMKQVAPDIRTAYLTSKKQKNLAAIAKKMGAEGLHIRHSLLNQQLVEACRKQGIALRVYTVNRPALMKKCYKFGVDAIFTDVPHMAKEYRSLY